MTDHNTLEANSKQQMNSLNLTVRDKIKNKTGVSARYNKFVEYIMPKILFLISTISIFVTLGIVYTLFESTITFFSFVSIKEFLTGTRWTPLFEPQQFGILPLLLGSVLVAVIAIAIAGPIGLGAAVYLSQYAPDRVKKTLKPILEVLAGVPTIVYGFFALNFITPVLQSLMPGLGLFNALSAGIAVGIMIIPMIASLSEDAMAAVPKHIREGAYALGSTRFEAAYKVIIPGALSGIIASFVLAISRAIGETMIVTIAAGAMPNFTFNPLEPVQTMTAYIVQVSLGDTPYRSIAYYTIYAVGMTLFIITFVMNIFANWLTKKFREEY
ncbi:phosphate ABC transporter permease subunit PstC [Desulfuribacillus stibiiarsenatis]|uniref:phosphate ABC transporter permease subunit PstC n=1 Tax=Desulfuribacillus stibiiarsenatis TaxID=1390249 RepID=UPI000B0647E6|nr:phosphate ABC transporter permease subunit PstC [Desulfuribacillus stibiiarsenatis]